MKTDVDVLIGKEYNGRWISHQNPNATALSTIIMPFPIQSCYYTLCDEKRKGLWGVMVYSMPFFQLPLTLGYCLLCAIAFRFTCYVLGLPRRFKKKLFQAPRRLSGDENGLQ